MNDLLETNIFQEWLKALTDKIAKNNIEKRIWRARNGNFGDHKELGNGVYEMRIHCGPGYRLYYFQHGRELYWLLTGGDKSSQTSDFELAKAIKLKVERGEKC